MTRRVLFSLLVFGAFLLALEVLLATTHLFGARKSWSEPDALLGWRFTPNRTYWDARENDHAITGRINSFGWRDRARSLAKPRDTYRIAVIGDSFVEAFQVELDSTFPAIIERQLNERSGQRIEVLNFGRSGMTQTEELLLLSEVAGYSPDLVVVFFVPVNDVSEVSVETSDTALRPFYEISPGGELALNTRFTESREYTIKAAVNQLKQHSALVSLVNQRYNLFRRHRRRNHIRAGQESGRGIGGALSLCTSTPDAVYARNYKLNKRLIGEMAGYCRTNGMRFMLVCADWVYKTEDLARYAKIDPTFEAGYFEHDLENYASALGIDYAGLQTPFERAYKARGTPLHWQHWNYDGHRLVAAELAARMNVMAQRSE
ncbi:MAG: SGNH/GDSL hydrolase family protein [Candidatus Krumholzibacteria bacterium]